MSFGKDNTTIAPHGILQFLGCNVDKDSWTDRHIKIRISQVIEEFIAVGISWKTNETKSNRKLRYLTKKKTKKSNQYFCGIKKYDTDQHKDLKYLHANTNNLCLYKIEGKKY